MNPSRNQVPARLNVVTLGVRDMGRLASFYKSLGWESVVEIEGDITTFAMQGALLSLFPLDKLAADGHVPPAADDSGIVQTMAIIVDAADEVDRAIAQVGTAGGRITKPPQDEHWGGRSAYFADPENNYWEVAWLPAESKIGRAVRRATTSSDM